MQWLQQHKKTIQLFITYLLGPILFTWVAFSIYHQLKSQADLPVAWTHIRKAFASPRAMLLVFALLLMPANWGTEALKWRIAIRGLQNISFVTAFKAILSGVSFSVTTPNRVGEYLGRILYMEDGNRIRAVSLTIACSISQLIITLVMGLAGLLVLRHEILQAQMLLSFWMDAIVFGVALAALILTLFYFRLAWLVKRVDKLPGNRWFAWLIEALEHFDATILWRLLSLSAARFAIFILQYYLLYSFFEVELSWWQTWWSVSVCFLIMAIIPTIALFTDLTLRGKIGLVIIGLFSQNQLGIGLAALSIWVINLIIPALAGSLLILGIKRIFKNRVGENRDGREEKNNNSNLTR